MTGLVVEVVPPGRPLHGSMRPPGSKSITNRALICAALAEGTTRLHGALVADDTAAMLDGLRSLGVAIRPDGDDLEVRGAGGPPPVGGIVDARLSGTTSRFLLPVAALGRGSAVVDGAPSLRARPMADLLDALAQLGAPVEPLGEPGRLPVRVEGGALHGGAVSVAGGVSSQFLSALLLSGPVMRDGLEVTVEGPLVSRPYVDMTVSVMEAFGARPSVEGATWRVPPTGYLAPEHYAVEPDASAASYLWAAAALTGGSVTVEGLGAASLQGDVRFADLLGAMGASVSRDPAGTTVSAGTLAGVDVDMSDVSDTAQTLAVVAVHATSPTTIRGIGFIRAKETDRVGAVATELGRCGIEVEELDDGLRVRPGVPRPALVHTYDDHRMAMSFALLGLRSPGIRIDDAGCVAKTFPGYWDQLEELGVELRRSGGA